MTPATGQAGLMIGCVSHRSRDNRVNVCVTSDTGPGAVHHLRPDSLSLSLSLSLYPSLYPSLCLYISLLYVFFSHIRSSLVLKFVLKFSRKESHFLMSSDIYYWSQVTSATHRVLIPKKSVTQATVHIPSATQRWYLGKGVTQCLTAALLFGGKVLGKMSPNLTGSARQQAPRKPASPVAADVRPH